MLPHYNVDKNSYRKGRRSEERDICCRPLQKGRSVGGLRKIEKAGTKVKWGKKREKIGKLSFNDTC
jgi:hypothetical protein